MRIRGWEIIFGSLGIMLLVSGILLITFGHVNTQSARGMIAGGSAITMMTFVIAMVSRMD